MAWISLLVAESFSGSDVALAEDQGLPINGTLKKSINSDTWETLEKLHKGEVRLICLTSEIMTEV